jgi:hydrogenase/urease accessory protein HupE
MKRILALCTIMVLSVATPAFAHRLDEYLQATTLLVEEDHVEVQMRLTPGVEVFDRVLAAIDANGDSVISAAEQRGYGEQVNRDLSLKIDGRHLQLRLLSCTFPKLEEMKEGLGEIRLNFQADLPRGSINRRLTLENHHLNGISVYLVNCLVPSDPNIHVTRQDRNYDQSFYQLDFTKTSVPSTSSSLLFGWLDQTGGGSLYKAFFYHGIHHILTGYDHLLFISALVLAATTFWDLIKVVTAFTVAHTITLTLAAFNLVSLPQGVVEPLISASIVFVALQNAFWPGQAKGRSRLGAAFFFGLFHGLGFAGGLLEAMREMQTGTMLLAILAFSIGIELGHQMVVLPLFGFLKAAGHWQPDSVRRTQLSLAFQRIGSAVISVAGVYYLGLALTNYYGRALTIK